MRQLLRTRTECIKSENGTQTTATKCDTEAMEEKKATLYLRASPGGIPHADKSRHIAAHKVVDVHVTAINVHVSNMLGLSSTFSRLILVIDECCNDDN